MASTYNEQAYNRYGVDFRLFRDGDDDRAFRESARRCAEEKQQRDEEQQERRAVRQRQKQLTFTLFNPEFVVPEEGIDFGESCVLQVCYRASDETPHTPFIRFTLRSQWCGRKQVLGSHGGTTADGMAKVNVILPKPEGWAEGEKVRFSFSAMIDEKTTVESEWYEMPSKCARQLFRFQMVSDSGGCSGKSIGIRGRSGSEVCTAFVPSYATKKVCCVSVNSDKVMEFYYPKPEPGVPFEITLQSGYDNRIPLNLPEMFFSENEPINILHALINVRSDYYDGDNGYGSFATLPANPGADLSGEEPLIIMELAKPAGDGGFTGGVNRLDGVSDTGVKVLYETVHGNTIAPGIVSLVEQRKIILDFCAGGTFFIKTIGGRSYVVFKGYAGLRRWYKSAKYLIDNAKVASISAATQGYGNAVKSAVKGSRGTTISFVFVGALDIYEWMQQAEGERFFSDLMVQMVSDGAQMVMSGIVGAVATVLAAFVVVSLLGTTIPVWTIVVGGIVITMLIGGALTMIDNHFDITENAKASARYVTSNLYETYKENVVEPICRFLYDLDRNIIRTVCSGGNFLR